VNDDGSISTFGDIYGHDARMIAALNKKSVAVDAPTNNRKVDANPVKQSAKRVRRSSAASNNFGLTPFGF